VGCARSSVRTFYEKNPHKRKIYNKKYYDKDPAKIRDRGMAWREKNPDKEKSRTKIYRDGNRDKVRTAVANWAKKNPLKRSVHEAGRRARKRAVGGSHTAQDILNIYEMQSGRCAYCRVKLKNKYHVDHIIPLAKGGSNDRQNLQILCGPKCNCAKGAKDPLDFARELGRLL
jgi:5-methylcytosine-specific restriction endonuclease McrA